MRKRTLLRTTASAGLAAFLIVAFAIPGIQAADKFPSRPLTMICPFAAGGGTDAVARMIASLMEQDLGQPVNVVNRTGGGGAVGHTAGATAAPDGYTMTFATGDITMLHWMGTAQVTHKEFRAVGQVNFDASAINVRADAPWKSVKEVQDYAKANPGKLKASGTGKGGCWDIGRAGWLIAAGVSPDAIPWVPSSGAAPALQDILSGGLAMSTCSLPEARALIEAKKIKSLAVMADKRLEVFPDIPTLKESGMNWSFGVWRGVLVPKSTPDSVVATLEKSLEKAYKNPKFKEFMGKSGLGMVWRSGAEFDKFMAAEDSSNQKVMKASGMIN
ncbi:MAG: tripartite tricarboxylate transporter substrate binding protein [Desulfobacteraceae bacterium]|nr:MAG: tripartite tricarboxylate transporter substrate binding protein [Desulfobacteraceae bacterium]